MSADKPIRRDRDDRPQSPFGWAHRGHDGDLPEHMRTKTPAPQKDGANKPLTPEAITAALKPLGWSWDEPDSELGINVWHRSGTDDFLLRYPDGRWQAEGDLASLLPAAAALGLLPDAPLSPSQLERVANTWGAKCVRITICAWGPP